MYTNIFTFLSCLMFIILLSCCNNKTVVCEYPIAQIGHVQGQIIIKDSINEPQKPLVLIFENNRFQDFITQVNFTQAFQDSTILNLTVAEKLTLEYATTYDARTTNNHFNFPLSPAKYYLCAGLFNPITRDASPKVEIQNCKNVTVIQDSIITVNLHIK